MNDSSTGGYLSPTSAAPVEDQELDVRLQRACRGITGLDGKLVFPRWQANVPNLPDRDVNWAAIGVSDKPSETYVSEVHDGAADGGQGQTTLIRFETIEVLASFYGPACSANASIFRDGLFIAQNREALQGDGIELVEVGTLTRAPELLKGVWTDRYDVPFTARRAVTRTYAVRNVLSAEGTVFADPTDTNFQT